MVPDVNDSLDLASEFSIMAWIQINGVTSSGFIILSKHYPWSWWSYYLSVSASNFLTAFKFGAGYGHGLEIQSLTAPEQNVWIHVACTYDGNKIKLYYNGVIDQERYLYKAVNEQTDGPFSIGGGVSGSEIEGHHFKGDIDEVRVYSHALTDEEVVIARHSQGINNGQSPVIVIEEEFVEADVNEEVILSVEDSYDPDGDLIFYRWTRLPENEVICFSPAPTCSVKGTGKVKDLIKVEAFDANGNSSEDQVTIVDRLAVFLYFQSQQ